MPLEILPALDVVHGRLVSASSDDIRPVDAFGGSPVAAARAFAESGARLVHVVDVDRALGGRGDPDLIARIAETGVAVQASGGVSSGDVARALIESGAARVVLGSSMLADRSAFEAALDALGDKTVVGIEADGDTIRPRAAGAVEIPLHETLVRLARSAARRYLYTGLSRVAGLAGPDLDGVRTVSAALGRPVLVAGGIRGVEDVSALRDLGPAVVEGVVVGRALYEGIDLSELVRSFG